MTQPGKLLATTEHGQIRLGDFVYYRGSVRGCCGTYVQVTARESTGRLCLRTATGGILRNVRPSSVRPIREDTS